MGKNFKELEVWQEGTALAVCIFKLWEMLDRRGYFALQDQMQRAVLSISSNIAEGSERRSANEFSRFLYIAKGSAAELRTQLFVLSELAIVSEIDLSELIEKTEVLSRKIQRLISVISSNKPSK